MPRPLDTKLARQALRALDDELEKPLRLLIGGGAAMALAHGLGLRTQDVDAIVLPPGEMDAAVDAAVHRVARALDIEPDWLNPYFEAFTFVLPNDYQERLATVFEGERLVALALSAEDLLVMKCFAGRDKDIPHARALMRKAGDLERVGAHLGELIRRGIPKAQEAADFFDDLRDEVDR